MGDNRLGIDTDSFSDDGDNEVEFRGAVDGEAYRFAVRYSVLEALSGAPVTGDAAAIARANRDALGTAALSALGRAGTDDPIVVSEADLDRSDDGGRDTDAAVGEAQAHPS